MTTPLISFALPSILGTAGRWGGGSRRSGRGAVATGTTFRPGSPPIIVVTSSSTFSPQSPATVAMSPMCRALTGTAASSPTRGRHYQVLTSGGSGGSRGLCNPMVSYLSNRPTHRRQINQQKLISLQKKTREEHQRVKHKTIKSTAYKVNVDKTQND